MVLSIDEHVFLVEYVFRKGSRYTNLVQEQFAEKFPETAKSAVYRDRPRTCKELKTEVTVYIETSRKQICRKCL
jgi:hypothetical protein